MLSGFPIPNLTSSKLGGRAIPITLGFTGAINSITRDLNLELQQNQIDMVQSIFIDNSLNGQGISVQFGGTLYTIKTNNNTQGIFPVICPTGLLFFTAQTTGAVNVPIILSNLPLPPAVWIA